MKKKQPLIIAHRGASGNAPENTLAAFRLALEKNADGIELDVRLSRDGVPVVFHDSTLKRTGKVRGNISDFSADELSQIDVGSWFNDKNPNLANPSFCLERVPTLEQVFDLLKPTNTTLYVELKADKNTYSSLVTAVADLIMKKEFLPRVIVMSFEHKAIAAMKNQLPDIRTGALFAPKPWSLLHLKRRFIANAQKVSANELALHYSLALNRTVKTAEKHQLPTVIWTANKTAWVKKAMQRGIYAVITNYPELLLAERKKLFATNS